MSEPLRAIARRETHLPDAVTDAPEPLALTEPDDVGAAFSASNGRELVVELAHDLRSPLSAVLTIAEGLAAGVFGPLTELQRTQARLLYRAALLACRTANDVLEVTRGGARPGETDPVPFSIVSMLASVRDLVAPMAEEQGLELKVQTVAYDHRLGAPRALGRVLLNLATNALKFTDTGFVAITAAEVRPGRIEFAVRDTGRGIHPSSAKTLLHPFRSAAATQRYYFSDTGLGLAVCHKLLGALGSRLRCETRQGWGTRFSFELDLPAVPAEVPSLDR